MILEILRGARWLDTAIARKLGATYQAVLGIGLVVEIVRHLRDFGELPSVSAGALRAILAVILFVLLLLHQIGEFAEHVDRRRERAQDRRNPGKP